jgi:histidinol dehydrogenase
MLTTAKTSLEKIAAQIAPSLQADLLKNKNMRPSLDTIAEKHVRQIIETVRQKGDAAVCEYTQRFDHAKILPSRMKVTNKEFASARAKLSKPLREAFSVAAANIRRFHKKQRPADWLDENKEGSFLGEKFTPLARVGIHVPGATANYPSSLLMTVIPAQIAGVKEIFIATPPRQNGSINPVTLAAADFLGVHSVFKMAGPQAVAAFAFGTKAVPKVDKIIGPGNVFVMIAKRQVFGLVGIDGLYGPSEVVVVADNSANPAWVAADLLAQAEHGLVSTAIVISPSQPLLLKIKNEVVAQAAKLSRGQTALEAWEKHGALVHTKTIAEALELANLLAPEHLELHLEKAQSYLKAVKNAGCILLGPYSPVSASDYVAGPSHSLPTGRSALFSSGLGVMDFMKRSDVVSLSRSYLAELAPHIQQFAATEGLTAHGEAVKKRLSPSTTKKKILK